MKNNSKRSAHGSLQKASKAYRALRSPSPKRHDAKAKPRFMSPTFSSSRQSGTSPNPPVTPESLRSVKTSKLIFSRVRDHGSEVSHSKGLPEPQVPYSEKIKVSIYETPPSQKRTHNSLTVDKPLPTPPSTAVDTSSPTKAATLLEVTEKPLRSPSHGGEDWPVLKPRRAVSTSPLQDVMLDSGAELKRQASTAEGERYPRLGDLTRASVDHDLHSIYSPKVVRKETSSPALMGSAESNKTRSNTFHDPEFNDPFQDPRHNVNGDANHAHSSSNLSASAAALEKSTSHDLVEVRQTRTSSMRARLSAGEIVKDLNSKITGFTDFTNTDTPTFRHRDSLRVRKQVSAEKVTKIPDAPAKKHSTESLNYAPTKMMTTMRRLQPRHSNSKGSLREDAQASVPSSRLQMIEPESVSSTGRPMSKGKDGNRSSIPIAKAGPTIQPKMAATTGNGLSKDTTTLTEANGASGRAPMQALRVSINNLGEEKPTTVELKQKVKPLHSIEESPRHKYTFRRLSTKSPEFGPTLAISPNARRLIMGEDADKENSATTTKVKRPSAPRLSDGSIDGKIAAATKKRLERPASSDGPASPRTSTLSSEARDKKSRSADVGAVNGGFLTSEKNVSKKTSTNSSVTNPFYDALENLDSGKTTPMNAARRSIAQDEGWISPLKTTFGSDVTVLQTTESSKANGIKSAPTQNGDEYDPFNYERQQGDTPKEEMIKEGDKLKQSDHSLLRSNNPIGYPARSSSRQCAHADLKPMRSDETATLNAKPSSSMQPPVPHNSPAGDHSPALMPPPSPHRTPSMSGPPTPPKDFIRRQNNLGAERGHASSQMDLLSSKDGGRLTPSTAYAATAASSARQSTTTPRPNISAQPNTIKDKRTSIIGTASLCSQASLPKSHSRTRFNLRTLFHKKSTEPVSPKKTSRLGKSKNKTPSQADITAQNLTPSHAMAHTNGSPFPPINEVHPIHRPTAQPSPRSSALFLPNVSNGSKPLASPALPLAVSLPCPTVPHRPATPPQTPSTPTKPATDGASLPRQNGSITNASTTLKSTDPPQLHQPTDMAISLLARARREPGSSPQKARLLELGKIMVNVITQARDAERAVEEAKVAVLKAQDAELAAKRARDGVWKGVQEIVSVVQKEEGLA